MDPSLPPPQGSQEPPEPPQLPRHPSQPPLSQLVRIDIEEPPRKMRLMFGDRREGQVVFLRSDGLRSRQIREEAKRNREEKEKKATETLERVIDDVAAAAMGSGDSGAAATSSEASEALEATRDSPTSSGPSEPFEGPSEDPNTPGPSTSGSGLSGSGGPGTSRMIPPHRGNRTYHPPRQFHSTSTMIIHKQRWSYRMACDIDAAEQNDDGLMYYIADPFLPMPRGRRSNTTAVRMNYAAQRLDNRKFRGQANRQKEIIGKESESATCDRCGMRYFMPSINMQERISYVLPDNEDEQLPTVLFECPVCKVTTRTD